MKLLDWLAGPFPAFSKATCPRIELVELYRTNQPARDAIRAVLQGRGRLQSKRDRLKTWASQFERRTGVRVDVTLTDVRTLHYELHPNDPRRLTPAQKTEESGALSGEVPTAKRVPPPMF